MAATRSAPTAAETSNRTWTVSDGISALAPMANFSRIDIYPGIPRMYSRCRIRSSPSASRNPSASWLRQSRDDTHDHIL